MRSHILKVAEELFYRDGIRAVGVDRLVSEAGVAKATFYSKFPSKHDLALAYLRARSERVVARLEGNVSGRDGPAKDVILTIFDDLAQASAPGQGFRGCAFMLAVSESAGDEAIRDIAVTHKSKFRSIFHAILGGTYEAAESLADQVAICYEGALTMIALLGDSSSVPAAKSAVSTILDAALRHHRTT